KNRMNGINTPHRNGSGLLVLLCCGGTYLGGQLETMRKTKIVCTIGPSSESLPMLKQLIAAGMNVARLNFSHGDFEEHGNRIRNIRQACKELNTTIAILLDTKGPEIRTGKLKEDS